MNEIKMKDPTWDPPTMGAFERRDKYIEEKRARMEVKAPPRPDNISENFRSIMINLRETEGALIGCLSILNGNNVDCCDYNDPSCHLDALRITTNLSERVRMIAQELRGELE